MAEGSKNSDEQVLRLARWLLYVAIGTALGVLAAYFLAFSGKACCDQEKWGQFGDYVGGSLNPALGLSSIILLVFTLRAQHRVLVETRQQGVREEVQRLLADTSKRLNALLAHEIDLTLNANKPLAFLVMRSPVETVSVRMGWITRPYVARARKLVEDAYGKLCGLEVDPPEVQALGKAPVLRAIFEEAVFLDRCLSEFFSQGGDAAIGRLYGTRYKEVALLLDALQRMGVATGVEEFGEDALFHLGIHEEWLHAAGAVEKYAKDVAATEEPMWAYDGQDPQAIPPPPANASNTGTGDAKE